MQHDPWTDIEKKYQIGQEVEGTVLKVNPFGLFVELDQDIHGLAHISELSDKPITDISNLAKEGDVLKFQIVSIEPTEHRLGLSLKNATNKTSKDKTSAKKEKPAAKKTVKEKGKVKKKKLSKKKNKF